ncbi:MAG: aspartate aminotransferase family protein [Dehalococcoidia bacterium]
MTTTPVSPAAEKTDWVAEGFRYLMNTGRRAPLTMVRGEGTYIWDDNGKRYLDFLSGLAVLALGHGSPVIIGALEKQARELTLVADTVWTIPQIKLAKLLCELSGMERVFFCNGGAEANEAALKLARKYGKLHKNGAFEVIATVNGFHGRTMGAISATGTTRYREPFEPLVPGFRHVPFGDMQAIRDVTSDQTCAVIVEPIQGEAGVCIPPVGYLLSLRRWCDEQNVALILDEVQTGIGRTGKMFAFEHEDIRPDILTLAKALGGGVPVAATLVNKKLDVFEPGDHGNTFGGNNLMTSVALAVLEHIIENNLVEASADKGRYMLGKLHSLEDRYDFVREARGRGLMCAIELDNGKAAEVAQACCDGGLILGQVRDHTLRLLPPLNVTTEEIDEAVAILDRALATIER